MITYQKFDNYYIFSHEPNCRVYLGEYSPDDYVEDEINQQKRSDSAWYKEIHTGKTITWADIMDYPHDDSKPGNGFVWYGHGFHELDKRENYTFEGGHTFDFERKITGLASLGNGKRYATYVKEFKTEAWAYVGDKTIEEQKEIERQVQARIDDFNRDHPWLVNLHDRLGHVDDEGNPISYEEHQAMMKARYGDDVFEKADEKMRRENPEAVKMAEKMLKVREATKDMTPEEGAEYLKSVKWSEE